MLEEPTNVQMETQTPEAIAMEKELKQQCTVGDFVAKARLVLLGFQDPELGEISSASPTLASSTSVRSSSGLHRDNS